MTSLYKLYLRKDDFTMTITASCGIFVPSLDHLVTNGYAGQCNNRSILILKVSGTRVCPIKMW